MKVATEPNLPFVDSTDDQTLTIEKGFVAFDKATNVEAIA